MDYQETIDYLYSQTPQFQQIGAAAYKPGLDTVRRLASLFGDPQRRLRCVHVGGTNGKGSTAHSLASCLRTAGLKVGLFTSPHLVDFRERIRVDGEMIPRGEVTSFVERFRKVCPPGCEPSFFELTTVMAFDWFERSGVDVAVIEVGLGGRLDSTNIIDPELCVITNISMDHMAQLGDTPESIAAEKAGIIKPGVPVVVGESEGGVRAVFCAAAAEAGAPLRHADDEFAAVSATLTPDGFLEAVTTPFGPVRFQLTGLCQHRNLRTILCALDELRRLGYPLTDGAVARGLSSVCDATGLMGRWMKVMDNPAVICDTGHNEGGWELLGQQLARYGTRLTAILGFVNDKDLGHIFPHLPSEADYIFTRASVPRALPPEELAAMAARAGIRGSVTFSVGQALNDALRQARRDPDAVIFVGGSTFVVADLLSGLGNLWTAQNDK
ncbi:MAG: bifunctional folylpolyglutamate synthase/dihydrofolate synthase [Muribaculaceae bacterium]|nr:bifunctional folylpolyglutamate synthase/dihydrofolate synthase [Muribaculaceae bacterium]